MPPRPAPTAAALLLALVPLALPDSATAASLGTTIDAGPTSDQTTDDPAGAEADADAGLIESQGEDGTTGPAPDDRPSATAASTPEPAAPSPAPAATPSTTERDGPASQPAPSPAAAVAPLETLIDVYAVGEEDLPGEPGGERVRQSTLNVKNASTIAIPDRTLDYHWTLDGPGSFRSSNMPFAVTYNGSPKVTGCTLTSAQQIDCIGANPSTLTTGAAHFNHIRTDVFIDEDALPGDVVTLTGWLEPNASTDYVNTATVTSTTWRTWVELTAAGIDSPTGPVGPTPTLTGTGVPGGTVDVSVAGRPAVTVPVDGTGSWALRVAQPLDDGRATVTAVQHRNGFTAPETTAELDVDAVAPAAPVVDAPGTLTDPTGPVTGVAEPGAVVIVRDDAGSELGRATAGTDGSYTVRLDAPLPEGTTELVVQAVDAVGNVSSTTIVSATVPDTTAPAAPVVDASQDLAGPTGPVTGSAEPGATVVVRGTDGTELGRGQADDQGHFAVDLDVPLDAGEHDVVIVAEDAAGNTSTPTSATVVAPDVTAPDAPISTTPPVLTDGTGPFTGSAERGATVIVRDAHGTELGRTQAGDDGTWTIVLAVPLHDGDHDLEVVAVDDAGNVSVATPVIVEVDSQAPNAPVLTGPAVVADGTGPLIGTAEPAALVVVRDPGGQELGRATADDTGRFSIVLDRPLLEGTHPVELVAEDAVGHRSAPTSVTITVDTTAPEAPVLTGPDELADGHGPVTGTAEPGATVVVRGPDGSELGRGTADDRGDFAVVLDRPLPAGDHRLEIIVVDAAGNESDATDRTVTVTTGSDAGVPGNGTGTGSTDAAAGAATVLPALVPHRSGSVAPPTDDRHAAAVTPPLDARRTLAWTGSDLAGLSLVAAAALGLGALLRAGARRRHARG